MRVFMTGATGFVGSALVQELVTNGHEVMGLVRSETAAAAFARTGAEALLGNLEDIERLGDGVRACDAAVHLGFGHDFSRFVENCEIDRRAIEAMGAAMAGTSKPLIVPNGMAGIVPSGQILTEADDMPADYHFPRVSEQTALRLASEGVNAAVIRVPQIHGLAKQGFVSGLVRIAREKRIAVYPGEGRNRWPAAHVSDVARLFRLVLEAPERGAKYHAVAQEGIPLVDIAVAIGSAFNVPLKSIDHDEVKELFGPLAMFIGLDMPASNAETRARTGWAPTGPTLQEDLAGLS